MKKRVALSGDPLASILYPPPARGDNSDYSR